MTLRRTLVPILALIASLTPAAPAAATYDPVGGGTTRITLDNAFFGLLKGHGVKLIAKAPVKLKGKTVTFPVSGGLLDPVAVKGSVDHAGSLVFQAGPHKLPLKALTLKTTQARSPLSAKFGGGQLKLAASAKLSTARSGFGLAAKVGAIKLSAKVAERLDRKLGLRGVFVAGQPFGTSLTNAQPATVAIEPAGKASLELAPEFLAKLSGLFVALNPIFPAEHLGPAFTLPIGAGQIAPDAASGTLQIAGSLEAIQQGGGQVFLRELWPDLGAHTASVEFDLEPSPPYPGKLGRVPILDLGAGSVSSNPTARTITVAGATASLQAATATAFNEAFAKPQGKANVFRAGDLLGTISFTAQAE
jgi:hypothetical protein